MMGFWGQKGRAWSHRATAVHGQPSKHCGRSEKKLQVSKSGREAAKEVRGKRDWERRTEGSSNASRTIVLEDFVG
jgi:hypothetical protein